MTTYSTLIWIQLIRLQINCSMYNYFRVAMLSQIGGQAFSFCYKCYINFRPPICSIDLTTPNYFEVISFFFFFEKFAAVKLEPAVWLTYQVCRLCASQINRFHSVVSLAFVFQPVILYFIKSFSMSSMYRAFGRPRSLVSSGWHNRHFFGTRSLSFILWTCPIHNSS